jgi:hypothetical protein
MIRCAFSFLCGALILSAGCGRSDKLDAKAPAGADMAGRPVVDDAGRQAVVPAALPPDSWEDRGRPAAVPGAIPETRPEIQAQIRTDRRPPDENSKYKDIKTPFIRVLMDSLDQAEGGTSA